MMNICFCIDENYVEYLATVLKSLVDSNSKNHLSIYVIHNGVAYNSQKYLEKIVSPAIDKWTIDFVSSLDEDVKKLEAGGHISSATYIRFEIPELLKELDKVLYLDADLIICDNLTEFYNTDVSDFYVGAIMNPFFDRYESIKLKSTSNYFNAGILLINLKKWRESDIKTKALQFLTNYKKEATMFDQDALNHVFQGQWREVPVRWNLQTSYLMFLKKLDKTKQIEVLEAYKNPGIVHFSSKHKPWDFLDPHPLNKLYKKYAVKKVFCNCNIKLVTRLILKYLYRRITYFWNLNV